VLAGGSAGAFAFARFLSSGILDPTFGSGGVVTSHFSEKAELARDVLVQPDGKTVIAGQAVDDKTGNMDFLIARYSANGTLDTTFGSSGSTLTSINGGAIAYAVALQPDGKVVLAGYTNSGGGPGVLFGADQLALARYTPAGLLDPTFGEGGKVVFDGGSYDERLLAVALGPGGTVLAGGYTNGERRSDLLLARLRPDGSLDTTFGNTGKGFSVNDLGTNSERISSLVLARDGKIVAVGQSEADFALVRFNGA